MYFRSVIILWAYTSLEYCKYAQMPPLLFFFFPVPVCAITASGVPGGTFVSVNRFSTLCRWLVQRQGWRVKGWIWPSEQPRSAKSNSWLDYQRPLEKWEMGESERGNEKFCLFIPVGLQEFFYMPWNLTTWGLPALLPIREEGVLRIFIALKIHRLGRVLNPQTLGPVASTLTITPPRRPPVIISVWVYFAVLPNVVVEWLIFLLRNREVPGSNHGSANRLSWMVFVVDFLSPSRRIPK
jgi:hypothetical protein